MKRLAILVLATIAFAGAVQAAGDAAAGKAKTVACSACHGADGNSAAPTFPKLAGQNEKYLLKQLQDVKSGARSIPTMAGQLDNLTHQDLEDIAAYFSSQPVTVGLAVPDLVERGERIFRAGDASKGVAACAACHSPTGNGNAQAGYPRLGGQHADYVEAQLKAFRTGAEEPDKGRINDGDTRMMRDVAKGMSDLDIRAVASYVQGLH